MLADLLAKVPHADSRVLLGPGIGLDAAVIDMGHGRVLVAKTDPVTFATDDIGWYAVNVNANDIACMGARPAWFLATALLPPGAPDALPGIIFDQLTAACTGLGIELVGGHTEVTLGLDRPIVIGAMLGEAAADDIVHGEGIRAGDAVLLTKGIAIEGTAVLAREVEAALTAAGINGGVIERARRMLYDPGISVVADAEAVRSITKPRLMHDPTEGGLAAALYEMADAAGMTIRIDAASVPIFEETRAVCDALGLDPMGLLASGGLLAIVAAEDAVAVVHGLGQSGIACAKIGSIVSGPPRVILGAEDSAIPLPSFARDELARFFDDAQGQAPNSYAGTEGTVR
jgi:hydrogenase expression/formation protein HypE